MIGTQATAPDERFGGRGVAVAARAAIAGCCCWVQRGVAGVTGDVAVAAAAVVAVAVAVAVAI